MDGGTILTIGIAATKISGGVQVHHLVKLCKQGAIPFQRAGRLHLVREADLETIKGVCRERGYYREEMAGV